MALDLARRASGVLLHPTSLPGPFGVGDLGPAARRFADFLAEAGQSIWQMLPVGPVGFGSSPYAAHSAFAGSPLLISLEDLVADRLLAPGEVEPPPGLPDERVDYAAAAAYREARLGLACARLPARLGEEPALARDYQAFREAAAGWLDELALYSAIKRQRGEVAWQEWPRELRARDPAALAAARGALAEEVERVRREQWLFDRQWRALRAHCRARGVALLGDVPLYLAADSADVWAGRRCFRLDEDGRPDAVAGVPPDYFSAAGQRWGNPLYDWGALAADGYRFWIERLRVALGRFDALRLDHFIGLARVWEIPADAPSAAVGRYRPGPGEALFRALEAALGPLPLVAEDLGVVTPEVRALRDRLGLPGIRVLQFAFGRDPCAPDFRPHNYPRFTVACTGTHDNDTTAGWFHERGGEGSTRTPAECRAERRQALAYLGLAAPEVAGDEEAGLPDGPAIAWHLIRLLLSSVASVAIVPMQDLLGLGSEARMNRPGTATGNWAWRLPPRAASPELAARLRRLCALYDRLPAGEAT